MHSFHSAKEAQAAGFKLASHDRQYAQYKNCSIFCVNTRWNFQVGAAYAIRAEVPDEYTANYLGVRSDRFFGKSVPVRIKIADSPSLAKLIAVEDGIQTVQMFEPPSFHDAIEEAKAWIDAWFRHNPLAMERALLRKHEARKLLAVD